MAIDSSDPASRRGCYCGLPKRASKAAFRRVRAAIRAADNSSMRGWGAFALALVLTGCSSQLQRNIPQVAGSQQVAADSRRDGGRTIVLHAYDTSGNRIAWNAFRQLEENGQGNNGIDDALLDPVTLAVTKTGPLYSTSGSSGDPSLTLPTNGSTTLSMAWPTSAGYSNLILDLPTTAGTYDFDELEAQQVVNDIHTSLAARSWYHPGSEFTKLYTKATNDFARGQQARSGARAGEFFARSLDAGVSAEMELLAEAGIEYAAAHPDATEWGATFDTITGGVGGLKVAAGLYPSDGWLRICFDPGEKPSYYAAEIANAHALGLHVVGQILDSSEMRRWSVAAFEQRTREYVSALPSVDEWETGNEINGNWLGSTPSVVEKTRFASKYIKSHTHARVLVTLYWQLGEDRVSDSTFTWARANMGSISPYVDDLGISLYPRQSPMGEPFDRVIAALHAEFPQQRIMITELDYDRGPGWWWGSKTSIAPQGRDAVAAEYQSAIMGYPYSGGGTFWWYFVEEVSPGNSLYKTLRSVYKTAH